MFGYCSGLTNVIIGSSVANVGYYAFSDCLGRAGVVAGSNVNNIASCAFMRCTNLTSLTFLGNAPFISSTSFYSDNTANITLYTAPSTTGWSDFAANFSGITVAPIFSSVTPGGFPGLLYPVATNVVQWSTNPAAGWNPASNAVALAAVEFTNAPSAAFFRLQSSGGAAADAGLSFYFGQPVLFYPTNGYTAQMATNLAAPQWSAPPPGTLLLCCKSPMPRPARSFDCTEAATMIDGAAADCISSDASRLARRRHWQRGCRVRRAFAEEPEQHKHHDREQKNGEDQNAIAGGGIHFTKAEMISEFYPLCCISAWTFTTALSSASQSASVVSQPALIRTARTACADL